MWAAEDEQLYLMVDDLLLEIREVDAVASVSKRQGAVDERAPVLADHARKGIVDGLLNDDGIIRCGIGADGGGDGKDDAGRDDELAALHRPRVMRTEPVAQDVEVVVLDLRIAKDAVRRARRQGVNDGYGRAKVHIRDPEREDILGVAALSSKVVFQTGRAAAVDDFVKIDGHNVFFSFLFGADRGTVRGGPFPPRPNPAATPVLPSPVPAPDLPSDPPRPPGRRRGAGGGHRALCVR